MTKYETSPIPLYTMKLSIFVTKEVMIVTIWQHEHNMHNEHWKFDKDFYVW